MTGCVTLWGDSIGKGVIYNEARKRYCLARQRCTVLMEAEGMSIDSHTRMGATIGEGFAEFQDTIVPAGSIAVIEYGGNDCDLDWDAVSADPETFHDGKTPLPQFKNLLARFIRTARRRGLRPAAAVPPPLEARRYFAWIARGRDAKRILRYLVDVQHIYRWQERYANAVREVAAEENCPVLDLRTPFLDAKDLPSLICIDGIHPNEAGQRLIAETAQKSLDFFRPTGNISDVSTYMIV